MSQINKKTNATKKQKESREEGVSSAAEDEFPTVAESTSDSESALIIARKILSSDIELVDSDNLEKGNSSPQRIPIVTRSRSRTAGPTSLVGELDAHREIRRESQPPLPSREPTSPEEDPASGAGAMEVDGEDEEVDVEKVEHISRSPDRSKEIRERGRPRSMGEMMHIRREELKKQRAEEAEREKIRKILDPSHPAPPRTRKVHRELQELAINELLGVSHETIIARVIESARSLDKSVTLSSNLNGSVKKRMTEAVINVEACCHELVKRVVEATEGVTPSSVKENDDLRCALNKMRNKCDALEGKVAAMEAERATQEDKPALMEIAETVGGRKRKKMNYIEDSTTTSDEEYECLRTEVEADEVPPSPQPPAAARARKAPAKKARKAGGTLPPIGRPHSPPPRRSSWTRPPTRPCPRKRVVAGGNRRRSYRTLPPLPRVQRANGGLDHYPSPPPNRAQVPAITGRG